MIKEEEEEAWRECCCGITEMCRSGFICMGQAWNWMGGEGSRTQVQIQENSLAD